MDKAERRRRRRRFDQEAATTDGAELTEGTPGPSAETAPQDEPEDIAADETAKESEALAQSEPASTPRPGAMAEVIGSTLPQTVRSTGEETAQPNIDPFFQRELPRTEFTAEQRPRTSASTPQPEAPPTPPPLRDAAPRPRPPARSWTAEPVLMALLLTALLVLAIDTYFTIRLNGLSDRLAATATKPTAASNALAARPWIGIGSIKTAPFANGGQPVTTVRFGNSGSEPAYDFRSNTVGSLRPSGSPPPDIPAQRGPVASAGVLVPNAEGILTFFANTRALTADEAGRVRSGQLVLWLAGRLDYHDPQGKPHLTTFRYQYNPSLNSFVAAPQGNAAS